MSITLTKARKREDEGEVRVGPVLNDGPNGSVSVTLLYGHIDGRNNFIDTGSEVLEFFGASYTSLIALVPSLDIQPAVIERAMIFMGKVSGTTS